MRLAMADVGWRVRSLKKDMPGTEARAAERRHPAGGPAYWLAAAFSFLVWSPGQPGPATVVNRTFWRG
jgi:hypothetical protein